MHGSRFQSNSRIVINGKEKVIKKFVHVSIESSIISTILGFMIEFLFYFCRRVAQRLIFQAGT